MDYMDENFIKGLEKLGLTLNEKQFEQFHLYYEMMVETNEHMNLTAITEYQEVVVKHWIDSLCIVLCKDDCDAVRKMLDGQSVSLIDVGTGAGFPGIPLKIVFPNIKITLMDSLQKRVRFLEEVVDKLGLLGATCVHGRAEELGRNVEFREKFDLSVSRAVAKLSSLAEFCIPFTRKEGFFLPYKAGDSETEILEAANAITKLGCKRSKTIVYQVPMSDYNRAIPVIRKVSSTSSQYPRSGGKPLKSPL